MSHYEERHRALRAAAMADDDHEVHAAALNIAAFEIRTGPLVDDLVAAVREHEHEATMGACAICDALAALDEVSGSGEVAGRG